MYRQKKKKIKISRIVFLLLIFFFFWLGYSRLFGSFVLDRNLTIKVGDTFSSFYSGLTNLDTLRIKRYIKKNKISMSSLDVGTYSFSGQYTPSTFVATVLEGPEKDFTRVTILEGRSIYDIDAYLSKTFGVQEGSYIRYVTDAARISTLQGVYSFLQEAGSLISLEGFLYPETYFIDSDADIVSALVKVQLDTFNTRIWTVIQSDLAAFYDTISLDYPRVSFDWYDVVTLASVIQKEEKIAENQPIIAGIFLRRLQVGMRLDADITLCYGLKQPYNICTPGYIARYVSDDTNMFNTRKKGGLPPQAIANIPLSAVQAVLSYKNTDYLYYLHDMNGRIYYGSTLEQHNSNKQQYLR